MTPEPTDTPTPKQEILSCPFCGGEMRAVYFGVAHTNLSCMKCHYRAGQSKDRTKIIAIHNTVARAVSERDELEEWARIGREHHAQILRETGMG